MSGFLVFDVAGLTLQPEEKEKLQHPRTQGVILFAKNFHSLEQLQELTSQIKNAAPHLFIAVDQEGGRVQRFKDPFFVLPTLASLGEVYASDPIYALTLTQMHAWVMASQLRAVGIDFSFTPVLDKAGCSAIIGNRAFGNDMQTITTLGAQYLKTLHTMGIASCGKHFPGHGGVEADSHLALPVDERSWQQLEQDLVPFKTLAPQMDAIMTAHIVFSQIAPEPVTFSKKWLQHLRQELGFEGLIFSDDLAMNGAAIVSSYTERARLALEAGCDLLLVCHQPDKVTELLDASSLAQWQGERTIVLKAKKEAPGWKELQSSAPFKEYTQALATLM